jgi:protocatechuate 3,4-dioxygenase beta subunit
MTAWRASSPCLAETPAKGTISGRVLTASGEPIRRATVVIEEVKYADGASETVADATTGDNGEFSFSNLAPARYRRQAERSGYVAGRFPQAKALVRLTSGDVIDDITLRLVAVCVVSGDVLDGNGDPLAKAVIRLLQYRYYPGGRRLTVAREVISDERGQYRIGDLNPGRYYVVASYHSRISDVVCPSVYYPEVASFDDALPIRLSPSDEAPIRFVLLPGKPVHVRGSVAGRGTGTVRVFLIPRGGVPYAQLLAVDTSDGWFQFQGVLPGDYTVLATSQSTDEMLEGRSRITVRDHDLNAVSVVLRKQMGHRRLWVSVDSALVSNRDVVISLHRVIASSEDNVIVAENDVAADARGISTRSGNPIDLPYPGPFVVSAEKLPGDFYIESADFQKTNRGPQIPGKEPAEYLEVHLNSHGGSAEGVVLDSTDHPLPGAVVVAIPDRRPNDLIDQSRTTTTDQHGQFVLHGLANSRYDIYAWEAVPDGAYYDPDFLADYAGTALGINIGSEHHYQVKLHAAWADEE